MASIVSLWDDLFRGEDDCYRKRPLIYWFLSLLRDLEGGIDAVVQTQLVSDPGLPIGAYTLQITYQMASCLLPDWQPSYDVAPPGADLALQCEEAERRLLAD